jgi:hypothetical protein
LASLIDAAAAIEKERSANREPLTFIFPERTEQLEIASAIESAADELLPKAEKFLWGSEDTDIEWLIDIADILKSEIEIQVRETCIDLIEQRISWQELCEIFARSASFFASCAEGMKEDLKDDPPEVDLDLSFAAEALEFYARFISILTGSNPAP